MTLDVGSPFKVISKPYIVAVADQTSSFGITDGDGSKMKANPLEHKIGMGRSKHVIITLAIVGMIAGIVVLARRGKQDT